MIDVQSSGPSPRSSSIVPSAGMRSIMPRSRRCARQSPTRKPTPAAAASSYEAPAAPSVRAATSAMRAATRRSPKFWPTTRTGPTSCICCAASPSRRWRWWKGMRWPAASRSPWAAISSSPSAAPSSARSRCAAAFRRRSTPRSCRTWRGRASRSSICCRPTLSRPSTCYQNRLVNHVADGPANLQRIAGEMTARLAALDPVAVKLTKDAHRMACDHARSRRRS